MDRWCLFGLRCIKDETIMTCILAFWHFSILGYPFPFVLHSGFSGYILHVCISHRYCSSFFRACWYDLIRHSPASLCICRDISNQLNLYDTES
jgi:hypothetical protein